MDKNELSTHYKVLYELHNEFLLKEMVYHGKGNKKVKETAYRALDSVLLRFDNYVRKNYDLYVFITSENGTNQERAFIWDELNSIRYFGRDMSAILGKIQNALNEK